jgi:hypothetical protein
MLAKSRVVMEKLGKHVACSNPENPSRSRCGGPPSVVQDSPRLRGMSEGLELEST